MTEAGLRRSRMWRAFWIRLFLGLLGLVGGIGAWLGVALWRIGTLRGLIHVAVQGLAALDGIDWLIGIAIGGVGLAVMLWIWAELMRRTHYLTEEELKEMTTKWVLGG